MTDILQVTDLSKIYDDVAAVDGIAFEVKRGQCFGLLGPNGAGKTTTLEMLEGIIVPSSGHILFEGKPATKESFQRFGIQFQNTALQDYMTVKETLVMFAAFYDESLPIAELIEVCDLEDIKDRDHRKLSGGQRQRLLLALALVNKPDVVFLDEPTTGLDPHARRDFWNLIERVKEQGKSIILTTHYMDEAQILCDDIAIMEKGKIIARGHPEALLNQHFSGVLIRLPKKNVEGIEMAVAFVESQSFVELQTDDVEATLSQLMKSKVSLEGLQVKSANLDDLFLHLTGHGLTGDPENV